MSPSGVKTPIGLYSSSIACGRLLMHTSQPKTAIQWLPKHCVGHMISVMQLRLMLRADGAG
jgi:hypothetical protein